MELLDVVDAEDRVIGTAPKPEIYRQLLPHRIVHVLIFNQKGEMALQLRSKNLSFCPHHWSTAVGGHVQSGESYEQAAQREYQEELNQQSVLHLFSKDLYQLPQRPPKFVVTFKTIYDGPFSPNPEEVEKVAFFSLPHIKSMIQQGERFHPELLFLLEKYF